MDNSYNETTGYNIDQQVPEEPELSHTDKIIGIFSEPKATFEKISNFPLKTIDWLLPIILLAVISTAAQLIKFNDAEVKNSFIEQQVTEAKKGFDERVEKGKMTREEADKALDQTKEFMGGNGAAVMIIMQLVGMFIWIFASFFLMALIYFLLGKFALKEPGTYVATLVASGLSSYIGIIQAVITAVLSVALGRMILNTSLGSMLNMSPTSYTGWVAAQVDPFTVWAVIIFSIGLAKLFRSESIQKFLIMVLCVWLLGGFLMFAGFKAIGSMF